MSDFLEPLIDAVVKGDDAIVLHILNLGGVTELINLPDEYGMTALHWTCANANSEQLVPLLLSKGAAIETTDLKGWFTP